MHRAKPVRWEYSGADWIYGKLIWDGLSAYIEHHDYGCKTRTLVDPATIQEEPSDGDGDGHNPDR